MRMKTVLIVDDDPGTAKVLVAWLERAGFRVATAGAGVTSLPLPAAPPLVRPSVDLLCGGDHLRVRRIGDGEEADVVVLAVPHAAGERLVHVLEPVAADEGGVVEHAVEVLDVGFRP